VYARTHSQTGGLLQIWLLRRFGTILSFQPILLGLILLSRRLWALGGVLIGAGVAVIIFVESYAHFKTRLPGRRSLSNITLNSLDTFTRAAKPPVRRNFDDEITSLVSEPRAGRNRGSMASVLEMMSTTLAVIPSQTQTRGPVPLRKCCPLSGCQLSDQLIHCYRNGDS
jgi:calcium permeable stress-gated cation channel